jgi:hypothetical protein
MIWIVSGPTSAGKSTFVASRRCEQMTALPSSTRVWFPKEIAPGSPPPGADALIHYNILRPFQKAEDPRAVKVDARLFDADPKWHAIIDLPAKKRAVVVVASKGKLVERVKARAHVEAGEPHEYGVEKWLRVYEAIDLDAVYAAWRAELARHGISAVNVDGERA